MKKILSIVLLSLMTISFTACFFEPASDSTGMGGEENLEEKKKKDYETTREMFRASFQLSGVSSINLYGKKSESGLETKNIAIKVKSDGLTAFLFPEEMDLPSVNSVFQNPKNKEDIIVVFENKPSGSYIKKVMVPSEYDENIAVEGMETVYYDLGQIVIIHRDGNYESLLKYDDKDTVLMNYWDGDKNVYFDAFGNTYFLLVENYKGKYSTENPTKYKICRYDYSNNNLNTVYFVSGSAGYKIYDYCMSEDLKWLFYQGLNEEGHYLRAVPLANPDKYVNLAKGYGAMFDFYYDPETKALFYPGAGYSMCPMKDDSFSLKDEVKLQSKPADFKVSTFVKAEEFYLDYKFRVNAPVTISYNYYENGQQKSYSKNLACVENSKANTQNMMEYLVQYVNEIYFNNLYDSVTHPDESPLTLNDIDIRFDKLSDKTKYKGYDYWRIAEKAKGKKNKEALEAVFGDVVTTDLFAKLINSDSYVSNGNNFYSRNFIAEIMYVKDSDTLLAEDNTGKKWFIDPTEQLFISSGTELQGAFCATSVAENYYRVYTWQEDYLTKEGKVNYTKLLQYFFSFCVERGQKYFSTEKISKDSGYEVLKSTLKNEKLLEWIISFNKTMDPFYNYMVMASSSNREGKYIDFISNTCFLESNGKSALPSDVDTNGISYPFNFFRNEKGLFCLSSYVFVPGVGQLLDEKNNIVFDYVPLLRDVYVTEALQSTKGTVLKVSETNEQGDKTGNQKLYYLKTEDLSLTELLTDFESHNTMIINSVTIKNDIVYCSISSAAGTKNVYIDLATGKTSIKASLYPYSAWLKL